MRSHFSLSVLLVLFACDGDDVIYGPPDAEPKTDGTVPLPDAGVDATVDASPPPPQRVLVTNSGIITGGELVAVGTSSGNADGRRAFLGYGVTVNGIGGPYLLESKNDLVVQLDPQKPWTVRSSWNVKLDDGVDGGEAEANPSDVVASSATKAYVLRFNRNKIAVIDPSQVMDKGAPSKTIDLSALLQADDKDGHVDMAGGVYDAKRKRLYVALSNIDINRVDPQGYFMICPATKATLIAIDVATDTLVDLKGAGPQGSIELLSRGVQFGYYGGVVLDADRILIVGTGCNDSVDGGQGPMQGRLIEAVDLSTNTTTQLLNANAQDFPGQLVLMASNDALIQFGYASYGKTYHWDATGPTLGAALPVAPDVFGFDPAGKRIIGPQATLSLDGGPGPTNVLSVNVTDGGSTILGTNPFTEPGYVGNAVIVP